MSLQDIHELSMAKNTASAVNITLMNSKGKKEGGNGFRTPHNNDAPYHFLEFLTVLI